MLNTATLMGRLTADPELRHTPNNTAVTSFTIAVDRSYQKQGAERQTDFIDIVAWRNTAEFVTKYFQKGSMIAVQGSIQTRSYTDNQGIKRKAFEIEADNVHFCGSKRNTESPAVPIEAEIPPADDYEGGDKSSFEEIPADDDLPFYDLKLEGVR